jgi:hypothetical protein
MIDTRNDEPRVRVSAGQLALFGFEAFRPRGSRIITEGDYSSGSRKSNEPDSFGMPSQCASSHITVQLAP